MQKVTMFGLGYIGLPTAAILASSRFEVNGVDKDEIVVETINQGKIHIVEPDLDGLVHSVVVDGALKAHTSPVESEIYLIAVPTPFQDDFEPDLTAVNHVVEAMTPILKEGDLVILESTSPVGTTDMIYKNITQARPELKGKISLAYCPERVLPGNILYELIHNDRIVGGIDEESSKKARRFYQQFVKGEVFVTNARTAEMCKLVENASRDVSIAFANELSLICDEAGIDVWELIALANRHPRVNILKPGVGVGGHCIAVDPWFLISRFPKSALLMRAARDINTGKTAWVIADIKRHIDTFVSEQGRKPVVACMGLAFKPNIDDLRMSPALQVAREMQLSDAAEFLYVEPNLESDPAGMPLTPYHEAYTRADIVAFLVAHKEFNYLNSGNGKIELDYCEVRKKL